MTLPLIPAPQSLAPRSGPGEQLTASHVDALATALDPWAPRAAAAARRTLSGFASSTSPETEISVSASLDASLAAEGCTLDLAPGRWTLTAADEAGAFWAVQSLAQIVRDGVVPDLGLSDAPVYPVRGMMLDIARYYFGPEDIRRVIDLAASYRLNQLHLHLSDDQGWRLEIPSRPLLTKMSAAQDVAGGQGGYLTLEDYDDLQRYALDRHVVVVPEVDLPGHTHAAQVAYPEISPDGAEREPYIGTEVGFSSLHLTSDEAWGFVDDVVATLAEHTLGEYVHLGGDESLTLTREQYVTYMERLGAVAEKHGTKAVLWQEAAGASLPAGTRLQYWTSQIETDHIAQVARDHDVTFIASPASRAYLDQKYTADFPLGLSWAALVDVRDAYDWDPVSELPGVPAESVVGVEACLWTETPRSFDDLTTLVLPRLPAVASVAWGSPKDFAGFAAALAQHGRWWDAEGLTFYRSEQVDWT